MSGIRVCIPRSAPIARHARPAPRDRRAVRTWPLLRRRGGRRRCEFSFSRSEQAIDSRVAPDAGVVASRMTDARDAIDHTVRQEPPMKKTSDAKNGASPSRLIDARIAELGDWRGETLARI